MKPPAIQTILLILLITTIAISSVSAQPRKLKGQEWRQFAKVMGNYRVIILGRDSIVYLKPVNDSIKIAFHVNDIKVVVSYTALLEEANYELERYLEEKDKYLLTPRPRILDVLEALLQTPPKSSGEFELPEVVDEKFFIEKERILQSFLEKGELEIYNKENTKQEYIVLRHYYCGKYEGCKQCIKMGVLYFVEGNKMFFLESMRLIS